jgi:HKD family nuclease
MRDIYTNSNKPPQNRFAFVFKYLAKNNILNIAVPFFSKSDVLSEALANGCEINLIVKLGDLGTDPTALKKLIDKPNINIRYFTKGFHSKLYIFGHDCAFVGSSNLTRNGLDLNSEINVMIPFEDPRFEILKDTFEEYWLSASPLTNAALDEYIPVYDRHNAEEKKESLKKEAEGILGRIEVESRITDLDKKKDSTDEFMKKFMRDYQVFLKKFAELRKIYETVGIRKIVEKEFPLRLEIDQFLSWIRVSKAIGESYLEAPLRRGADLKSYVIDNIREFIKDDSATYINTIVHESYPIMERCLNSQKSIDSLDEDMVFELLCHVHAFYAAIRYHGGEDEARIDFFKANKIDKIRKVLKYLFFGPDSYEKRIAVCRYNEEYSLMYVGESCIKELFGWANKEEVPIYNERTAKSMQWLGFGIV